MENNVMLRIVEQIDRAFDVELSFQELGEDLDLEAMSAKEFRALCVKTANKIREEDGREPLNAKGQEITPGSDPGREDISKIRDADRLHEIWVAEGRKIPGRDEKPEEAGAQARVRMGDFMEKRQARLKKLRGERALEQARGKGATAAKQG